ncbi:MAG: hypothetical protein CMA09_03960 [Euryarchaeota archaeon]|nr:hypothetical protein [Euryarchaeota archaeon]|tara:strand:+ start:3843 stop:4037 length:195 start_codon:yes stop_codon:yes gene_type:complete
MSYWESLTETHEILAWEEGRLQGMQDLRRLIYHTKLTDPIVPKHVLQAIREQQEVIDEIRGEEE